MDTDIKYSIPLEWSITKEYVVDTIVFSGKTPYKSLHNVPLGINLDNDYYWVKTGILGVESRIDAVSSDIANLDTRVTTAESDIANLDTRVTTAESDIDAAESDIANLATRVTTAENNIVNHKHSGSDITSGTISGNRLPVFMKVQTFNTGMISLSAGAATTNNMVVPIPSGYELVGAVGFASNHGYTCTIQTCQKINDNTIKLEFRNNTTGGWTDLRIIVDCLFVLANVF